MSGPTTMPRRRGSAQIRTGQTKRPTYRSRTPRRLITTPVAVEIRHPCVCIFHSEDPHLVHVIPFLILVQSRNWWHRSTTIVCACARPESKALALFSLYLYSLLVAILHMWCRDERESPYSKPLAARSESYGRSWDSPRKSSGSVPTYTARTSASWKEG